jgi:3'(2'), 5'-bisphosphate nucleotidase
MKLTTKEIDTIINTLQTLGEEILKIYTTNFTHELKEDNSPLTQADMLSHNSLMKFLTTQYPTCNIISEEDEELPINHNSYTWVIDPLDGTKDFIQKTDEFSIMLALLNTNKQPIAGFVYAPALKTLWYAQQGQGAYCIHNNEKTRLQTSNKTQIQHSTLIRSRSHFSQKDEAISDQLNITKFIQAGSVGIKFSKIAQAEAEICYYTTSNMGIWDDASSHIILKEAGGDVFDMNSNEPIYDFENRKMKNGFIGTNGNIKRDEILNAIQNA